MRLGNVLIRQAKVPPAKEPVGFCCLCQKRKKLPCGTPGFEKSALQMSRFKRLEACYPSRCDGRKRKVCCGIRYGSLLLPHLPSLPCPGYRHVSNTELLAGNMWVIMWPRNNGIHRYWPLELVLGTWNIYYAKHFGSHLALSIYWNEIVSELFPKFLQWYRWIMEGVILIVALNMAMVLLYLRIKCMIWSAKLRLLYFLYSNETHHYRWCCSCAPGLSIFSCSHPHCSWIFVRASQP